VRQPHAASFDRPRHVLLRRDSQAGGRLISSSRPLEATTRLYAETATARPQSCGQVLQRYWRAPRAPLGAAVNRAHNGRFAESVLRQGDVLRRRARRSTSTRRHYGGATCPRRFNEQARCHVARSLPLALPAPLGAVPPLALSTSAGKSPPRRHRSTPRRPDANGHLGHLGGWSGRSWPIHPRRGRADR